LIFINFLKSCCSGGMKIKKLIAIDSNKLRSHIKNGAPERARTSHLTFRKRLLYPDELRTRNKSNFIMIIVESARLSLVITIRDGTEMEKIITERKKPYFLSKKVLK
jgi:hypothetical protein